MVAWMNADTLRQSLTEGRTVFWSRSRQEVWRKGDTCGRPPVRARGLLRLRRRHAALRRRAGGQGRLPHRRAHLLLPGLRVTQSGPPGRSSGPWPGSTPSSPCGARCSPTSARPSPRSSERWATTRASSWSPSSTASAGAAGRSSAATRWPRSSRGGGPSTVTGQLPDGTPLDDGDPGRHRAPAHAASGRPRCPTCPPLHGGIIGYLGYDVVREVEHLPDVPPDDQGHPDAVVSVIGAARRLRPLAPAGHARSTTSSSTPDARRRRARRALRRRRRAGSTSSAADGAGPLDEPLVDPPDPDDPLPDVRSTMGARRLPPGRRGGQGAHPRRRHLPGRAGPALRPRPRRRRPSTCTGCSARSTRARTCTSCATRG